MENNNKQTTVELIYKYLEQENIETVMQLKDMFLKLEKTSLDIAYEEGVLSQMYKSSILEKILS
jgi:hypothetical protein